MTYRIAKACGTLWESTVFLHDFSIAPFYTVKNNSVYLRKKVPAAFCRNQFRKLTKRYINGNFSYVKKTFRTTKAPLRKVPQTENYLAITFRI